jgi:hypothetical protein
LWGAKSFTLGIRHDFNDDLADHQNLLHESILIQIGTRLPLLPLTSKFYRLKYITEHLTAARLTDYCQHKINHA